MSIKIPCEAFDHQKFMEREFPNPTGRYPDVHRLSNHLDKITSLLLECANQALKVETNLESTSPLHANTRYTIVGNYRLRTISLLKVFTEVVDIEDDSLFDEGTANIIVRSLLESYLVITSCIIALIQINSFKIFIFTFMIYHRGYSL